MSSQEEILFKEDENESLIETRMIRAHNENNTVYFAATYPSTCKVLAVSIDKEVSKFSSTLIRDVFVLTNVSILAME